MTTTQSNVSCECSGYIQHSHWKYGIHKNEKVLGYEKKYIQINKNYTHLYYQMNFIENTDRHKSTLV